MATVLNLVYGSTTVNLNSSGITLREYIPEAGTRRDLFVTENIDILISAASETAAQALINSIEKAKFVRFLKRPPSDFTEV